MLVREIEALTGSMTKLCILSLVPKENTLLYYFAIIQIPHNANVGNNGGYELLPNLTEKVLPNLGLKEPVLED